VKLEVRSRAKKRVSPLGTEDHLQFVKDLSPILAEQGVPSVDETVWVWAIKRLWISGLKNEKGIQRKWFETRDMAK
jgi:hypothetical protein